jgi:hypothetical protein
MRGGELRDYQQLLVADACEFLATAPPGARRLYAAPTGTGKSWVELEILCRFPRAWLVTPRLEIVAGMITKLGLAPPSSLDALVDLAWSHRITTPIRLRNEMLAGTGPEIEALIVDESHHHTAATYQQIDLMAAVPAVGFTATPFRGTPKGTAAFLRQWGEPVWGISYPEAVARGVLAMPECRTVPLVDDDVVAVQNGEFVVQSLQDATQSRLDHAVSLCSGWCNKGCWDRPTMAALPAVATALDFTNRLLAAGLPAVCVTGDTPHGQRFGLFTACLERKALLVQVQVIGEGVDLPLRRLLDLAPSLSPVKWLQQLGRITRPGARGEPAPEYVCCNRNLLRHAYLLEGCLPARAVAGSEEAFGGVGRRGGMRVLGLEAIGRFKAAELPLANGTTGLCYLLATVEGTKQIEYAALCHPLAQEPIWAKRTNFRNLDGTSSWGKWRGCLAPEDVIGFASKRPSRLTERQTAWWQRSAQRYGLNPDAPVTAKNFTALPILTDLGLQLV